MSISTEREPRYTWGGDKGGGEVTVVEIGKGKPVDLAKLVQEASTHKKKAEDAERTLRRALKKRP